VLARKASTERLENAQDAQVLTHLPLFFLFPGVRVKINNTLPLNKEAPTQAHLEDQLHKASEMYEQHFLNEMVKAMRSTIHKDDGFLPPNMAENIFSEQLDQQYVEKWSAKGGIGLSDLIYEKMHERLFPKRDLGRPAGPVPFRHSPMPFDMKVEPKKDGNGGRFLFRGDPSQSPAPPVVAPWKGRVESAAMDSNGWSHVSLSHENQLRSQIAYRGQLAALEIGADVEEGQSIGILSPTDPILRWDVSSEV
jgi:flagellar protein FlgJ